MKVIRKNYIILKLDIPSAEQKILQELLSLDEKTMQKLGFSEEQYRISADMYCAFREVMAGRNMMADTREETKC